MIAAKFANGKTPKFIFSLEKLVPFEYRGVVSRNGQIVPSKLKKIIPKEISMKKQFLFTFFLFGLTNFSSAGTKLNTILEGDNAIFEPAQMDGGWTITRCHVNNVEVAADDSETTFLSNVRCEGKSKQILAVTLSSKRVADAKLILAKGTLEAARMNNQRVRLTYFKKDLNETGKLLRNIFSVSVE